MFVALFLHLTTGGLQDRNFGDYNFSEDDNNNSPRSELIFEFKILCAICYCLHFYLTQGDASISSHLRNLSKLSHLLFVVFRKSEGNFIFPQNYHNLQSVVKAAFKSVATCKFYGIDVYYLFQDNNDRLENLFREL